MECPKCGNEINDTDKVCPFCKKRLMLECPVCHKWSRTAVCDECGFVIIVKCNKCGTLTPNISGKCRKCGFDTAKSVIMNEAETEEYACLAITFPNLEDLRPALKNKTIFNKFKKKLKEALFEYAKNQDNRAQVFGETYVIKYYKEFSLTSSVKKAVQSAIELLNKIGGISYKLKKSKNARLHCKMVILKKTFETDTNEFNTGLNIKLIKDNTEEKYTDGLQLITDQYVNNIVSREYTLEMIYSSQVGDELLMFYEFPLENQIIPITEKEDHEDSGILKNSKMLPKLKIYDDDDGLNEILYGNKAIDITTEGQFLSVPAHDIFNVMNEMLSQHAFITLKTTERRDLPTLDLLNFLKTKSDNVIHVICKENFKFKPYAFFRELIAAYLHLDTKQENIAQKAADGLAGIDENNLLYNLLTGTPPEDIEPDSAGILYGKTLREFIASNSDAIIFIDNFDLIDETSARIISDYIYTLVNLEDLALTFVVTVRADYSIYKNIPRLLHLAFYKEINVIKGSCSEFLASVPDDTDDLKNSFYFHRLEEICAGSLVYFKNELQYMLDTNTLAFVDKKLIINNPKTIIFPAEVIDLFMQRFKTLPENEELVLSYTVLSGGYIHISLLEKLDIENLNDAIDLLSSRQLILFENNIVEVQNFRIFEQAVFKALVPKTLKILAAKILVKTKYKSLELLKLAKQDNELLQEIYNHAIISLYFGDFNSYLNCTKYYFNLIEKLRMIDENAAERKNELISVLVHHLNRYPSTKIHSISKVILANAVKINDDNTIVKVSNLVLDSALSGNDFMLAHQCVQNILIRILNPKLLAEGQDFTHHAVLYSCIYAKIAFNLAQYSQCMAVCDKILLHITPDFIDTITAAGINKDEFISYVLDTLTYSALSRIIICDETLESFCSQVENHLGCGLLSKDYLILLDKLIHLEEFDIDAGISSDIISMFISNILTAFKSIDEGYNTFAQNVYKAKLSVQNDNMKLLSLFCDLLIGFSYQKILLNEQASQKKCETIYADVYHIAQKSGFTNLIHLTNWFKSSLLKDKGLYEEAYELILSVTNALKRSHIRCRPLDILSYILMLNIVCHQESRKSKIPALVYRIKYEAEKYNFEAYYKFIENQELINDEYIEQFKDQVSAEKAALEEEIGSDDKYAAKAEAEAIETTEPALSDESAQNIST